MSAIQRGISRSCQTRSFCNKPNKPNQPTGASTEKENTMASYIDGFVIPVPKKKVDEYVKIARKASKVWKDHGALEYWECVGDDLKIEGMTSSFPKITKAKPDETVIFSWIRFKSRKHRDQVNAKVMKDPRLVPFMKQEAMPFDMKRMTYGGFKSVVSV